MLLYTNILRFSSSLQPKSFFCVFAVCLSCSERALKRAHTHSAHRLCFSILLVSFGSVFSVELEHFINLRNTRIYYFSLLRPFLADSVCVCVCVCACLAVGSFISKAFENMQLNRRVYKFIHKSLLHKCCLICKL